jgi:glycosyltransferase involved in cell wall biosynthesis
MNLRIGLFFTRGVSLKTWDMVGNLDREVAVYRRMIEEMNSVTFVTYGDSSDLSYADRLGGIRILCNEGNLGLEDYESHLHEIHKDQFEEFDIIKTNQMYGAELALAIAKEFGKPFIARCGYMWSKNCLREQGPDSPITKEALRVEARVFDGADSIFVTTHEMAKDVLLRLPWAENKLNVVPNYVDTDVFRPLSVAKEPNTLIFVGRIAPEKNLEALFEAILPLNVRLIVVGEGRLRPRLQEKYAHMGKMIDWEGGVRNSELPEYINRAQAFILPSLYEGHPKSLIEAMACAAAVIGCDSPGIREIITDGQNGLLCGTDAVSIRTAVTKLLADKALADTMARNASEFVQRNCSLDTIAKLELSLIKETHRNASTH